jgi:putative DNA primase/helicase
MNTQPDETIESIIAGAAPYAETTEEAVLRLAQLAPLEYDRHREGEAKRLSVRLSTLDAEVMSKRSPAVAERGGDGTLLSEAEPWPDAVNGAELLDDLVATVSRYLVLPPAAPETIALWVMHAHLHDTASISPILAVTSPSPECGKTTLLDLLGALVPRPLPASNITAAALFRAVEKWQPTMLVDEADTFIRDSDELRGVLNSGHRRSAAYVVRTVGEDHDPRQFRTWAPKAIALIGKLPPTLASRSIEIELRRKTATEIVDPLRGDRLDHLEPLRRRCTRFAVDAAVTVRAADPEVPHGLRGRAADNWRHMIAIADVAGANWPALGRAAAVAAQGKEIEETAGVMLLRDLRRIFGERRADELPSKDLAIALAAIEEGPWSEWKHGSPISQRQIAGLLKPFKIEPDKLRPIGRTPGTRGYKLAEFRDAFVRYLPDDHERSATAPEPNETVIPEPPDAPRVADTVADRFGLNSSESAACGVVADRKPENAPNTDIVSVGEFWENRL